MRSWRDDDIGLFEVSGQLFDRAGAQKMCTVVDASKKFQKKQTKKTST